MLVKDFYPFAPLASLSRADLGILISYDSFAIVEMSVSVGWRSQLPLDSSHLSSTDQVSGSRATIWILFEFVDNLFIFWIVRLSATNDL